MKIYGKQNVFDAAMERTRWLFREFDQDNLAVNFSGGKDSTVTLNIALRVAEELGRLPLPVIFLDQEAEWRGTIEYVEQVMTDPRVKPIWSQVEFKLSNSASSQNDWLYCWKEGDRWLRPKHPISKKVNVYGTDRFSEMLGALFRVEVAGDRPGCKLAGVRAEESPARLKGLTSYATYKGRTWGNVDDKARGHITMYPLYDWSYTDVWKAIHDNGWAYNEVYDHMFRYGLPVNKMRVSSLNHETALGSAFFLQEIEPETYTALIQRIDGYHAVAQLRRDFLKVPEELPWMFSSWEEYRDHLIDQLVPQPEKQAVFRDQFAKICARYEDEVQMELVKAQIGAVLTDDFHGTKMSVFAASHGRFAKNRGSRGGDVTDRYKD